MTELTALKQWSALIAKAESMQALTEDKTAKTLAADAQRFILKTNNIHFDFSRQRIDESVLTALLALAQACDLKSKIQAMFRGDKINISENRPVLHSVLRSTNSKALLIDDKDIMPDILAAREKMWLISSQIRAGQWLGFSGKVITDIVNIGMGGSDFGPRFCIKALSDYAKPELHYHFISDIDPNSFEETIAKLEPETTLFIVSSKSFTTHETLYNAKKALAWIGNSKKYYQHFIAATAHSDKAEAFGIKHVVPIWDWVGGRYSLCSSINLITCIAIGYERFLELLAGANSMDRHFQHSPLRENIPVIMALLGIWNINFLQMSSLLLLVYNSQLELLIPYIQQLDMESNGKSVTLDGKMVDYATGPIVWGGVGNQAQHSYYQLLCQGTHAIAADFISSRSFENEWINAYCNAKISTLSEGIAAKENNNRIKGGMPINHLSLQSYNPFSLGELIALYEHKIFTQGVLWQLNSFDQPGVESAKKSLKIEENSCA